MFRMAECGGDEGADVGVDENDEQVEVEAEEDASWRMLNVNGSKEGSRLPIAIGGQFSSEVQLHNR